jgi:hypothetical protein
MLTSIVEFACSNFCATTTQVKMKVSNKREKGGWGVWDSNETWAPNCKKIATRIISFSFIHAFKKWVVIREFIPANHAQLFSKQFGQNEIQNWVGLKEMIHA